MKAHPAPRELASASTIHQGMGAVPHAAGVAFRVWAPHAQAAAVVGSFNDWKEDAAPMAPEKNGFWYADVAGAKVGDEYRFLLVNGEQKLSRIDPYAREVTNSVGNAIVHDTVFDWERDEFKLPPLNELVIYELHVGSFFARRGEPGDFEKVAEKFSHLKRLGVNALEIMPAAEFAGDYSWGYNPAHIFAVEQAYGGPQAFKQFVKQAHREGFGVILDVVYNHFGPSDLSLWTFDGWSENDKGGIYFYNDWKSHTPWGDTRPDYGRGEVRQFIRDNAMMWLDEYRVDGLRFDMTLYMRHVRGDGDPGGNLPEGWSLAQWINTEIRQRFPGKITIAEDLQDNEALTSPPDLGGAGFHAQWDARFVHPVRSAIIMPEDRYRSMDAVAKAIGSTYNGDAFRRVVYTESHDEVANGKARVPTEIAPDDPGNLFAQKRSGLGAALVFTSPGVPMLFQGQEFLQGEWFRDDVPLDWDLRDEYRGMVRLYRDLVTLRLNRQGTTRGLCGQHVDIYHNNDPQNVIAFRRWDQGGRRDDTIVIVNLSNQAWDDYKIGLPATGVWRLRLNSDDKLYSPDFSDCPSADLTAGEDDRDGTPASASLRLAPYSVLIYSQD